MMANVFIKIGDNGKDVPEKVIEVINAIMCSGISTARVTLIVDGVNYTIVYEAITGEDKE